jgi:hypothetical protein
MKQEYFIADNSVKYNTPINPLNCLIYKGNDEWCRDLAKAQMYTDAASAVAEVKRLNNELPVKLYMMQTEPGKPTGIGEVKY